MPALAAIALRYLAWVIGLRVLYVGLTATAGLPNSQATIVILATAPAIEIAMYAMRKYTVAIPLKGWATIWFVLMSVYLVVFILVPVVLIPQFRAALSDETALRSLLIVTASTAAMLALFLWIGTRAGGRTGGN